MLNAKHLFSHVFRISEALITAKSTIKMLEIIIPVVMTLVNAQDNSRRFLSDDSFKSILVAGEQKITKCKCVQIHLGRF